MSSEDLATIFAAQIWRLIGNEFLDRRPGEPLGIIPRASDFQPAAPVVSRWVESAEAFDDEFMPWARAFLAEYALQNEIDPTERGWVIDVIVQLALEHPALSRRLGIEPARGRPQKKPSEKYVELHDFLFCADRLKTMMHLHRGQTVSDAELARQIEQRKIERFHLANSDFEWPDTQSFVDAAETQAQKINRYRREIRDLLVRHPGIQKNPPFFQTRHKKQVRYSWAPSNTELERYPGWKAVFRKMQEAWRPQAR